MATKQCRRYDCKKPAKTKGGFCSAKCARKHVSDDMGGHFRTERQDGLPQMGKKGEPA